MVNLHRVENLGNYCFARFNSYPSGSTINNTISAQYNDIQLFKKWGLYVGYADRTSLQISIKKWELIIFFLGTVIIRIFQQFVSVLSRRFLVIVIPTLLLLTATRKSDLLFDKIDVISITSEIFYL